MIDTQEIALDLAMAFRMAQANTSYTPLVRDCVLAEIRNIAVRLLGRAEFDAILSTIPLTSVQRES